MPAVRANWLKLTRAPRMRGGTASPARGRRAPQPHRSKACESARPQAGAHIALAARTALFTRDFFIRRECRRAVDQ